MPTTPRLPKLRNFLLVLVLVCVVSCRPHAPASRQAAADPVAGLSLDVPATTFVLPNGLTVVVHEDHAAPLVAVNIWYHVGSKNEPPGKTGFAHLFEHLMFNGSEHFNDDFFKATQKLGRSEEHTSELQSLMRISYAVFRLKKKKEK